MSYTCTCAHTKGWSDYCIGLLYFGFIVSWFHFLFFCCILISYLSCILIIFSPDFHFSSVFKFHFYTLFWFYISHEYWNHFLMLHSDFIFSWFPFSLVFWFHIFSVSTVVWFISLQNLRFIPVFWFHFSTILWRNQVFGLLNSAANHLPWAPDNNGYTSLLNELSWRAKQFGLSCNLFIMLYQCD